MGPTKADISSALFDAMREIKKLSAPSPCPCASQTEIQSLQLLKQMRKISVNFFRYGIGNYGDSNGYSTHQNHHIQT